jgi:hypothetical protein
MEFLITTENVKDIEKDIKQIVDEFNKSRETWKPSRSLGLLMKIAKLDYKLLRAGISANYKITDKNTILFSLNYPMVERTGKYLKAQMLEQLRKIDGKLDIKEVK